MARYVKIFDEPDKPFTVHFQIHPGRNPELARWYQSLAMREASSKVREMLEAGLSLQGVLQSVQSSHHTGREKVDPPAGGSTPALPTHAPAKPSPQGPSTGFHVSQGYVGDVAATADGNQVGYDAVHSEPDSRQQPQARRASRLLMNAGDQG